MKKITLPVKLFEDNRKKLSQMLPEKSLVILHANDEMSRSADQFFPYRQDSDLYYFSGIDQEKTILLMAPGHPDKKLREVLLVRHADKSLETWEGHKYTPDEARAVSGIDTVKTTGEYESVLAGLMAWASQVYLNLPEHQKFIPELPVRNVRLAAELKAKFPAHRYERLAPVMCDLRTVKSAEEISLIKQACSITRSAFLRILQQVRPGMMEYEIEAEMSHEFMIKGATGHAFPPIVASGANACTLHYVTNDSRCNDGDLLLMDFGADYGYYAADCSRTFPVNGRFTDRQRMAYESVLEVFRFARSLMKPGATINEVHEQVCRRFEKEHIRLGLYTKEELDKQDSRAPLFQQYYMHGTSHFMGLDVHDPGSKDAVFKPGMVLTCEPGLYIPAEKMGIRIENDILITEDGNVDLMADIPIEADDIEKLMRSR